MNSLLNYDHKKIVEAIITRILGFEFINKFYHKKLLNQRHMNEL